MDAAVWPGDVALTAGAGSGKTRALVDAYLAELVRPREDGAYTAMEELVAITFTEKAAAEMLDRVGAGLTGLIKELQKDEETRARLELMEGGAGSLDALRADGPQFPERLRLLDHLIRQRHALKSAYISTIHSFCARMLWENPLAGEVDPSFMVLGEEDAEAMLRAEARRVVRERLAAGDEGVAELVRDLGFMPGKGRARGVVDYLAGLAPLIRAANTTPAAERQKAVDRLGVHEAAREGGARDLAALLPELRMTGKSNSHERRLAEALDAVPGLLDGSLSAEEAGRIIHEARRRAKERAKNGGGALLDQAAGLVTLAAGPALERVAVERVVVFTMLLERVLGEYSAAKRRMAALDFEDLEEKAKRLFIGMPAELSRRFRRVLVDEFQDINELQASIINLLAQPGEGRLFIVGDPKQSIYGFRGAQVGVFHEMTRRIGASGRVDALRESRRSIPALVEFHNRFFTRLMRPSGEAAPSGVEPQLFDPMRDALIPTRPPHADGPAVRRIVIPNPAGKSAAVRALEAEAIALEIGGAVTGGALTVGERENGERRPAVFGDFAILLRTLTGVETYESALRRAGIPFQTVKGRGYYHCQEVLDFANLLTWLDAPSDTLAFMSLLRSPLCGVGDDTLLRLRIGATGEPLDPARILDGGAPLPDGIEPDDAGRLAGFCAKLKRWRAARDRVTVAELLEGAIAETDYGAVMLSRFNGEQYLANLFKLIEQARARPAGGPGVFAARLRALIENDPGEAKAGVTGGQNAVSIMSVHQSKGLEYPAVFLADLNFSIPLNPGLVAFHAQAGLALRHFDLARGEWLDPPSYLAARDAEQAARREELKRLLYVAMTRARDRLWLTGPKEKPRGEWVKWIDEAIDAGDAAVEVTQFDSAASPAAAPAEEPELARRVLAGWAPDSPPEKKEPEPPARPELRLTATELATFSQCPRLFYLRSVTGAPLTPPAQSFDEDEAGTGELAGRAQGALVHEALETIPLGAITGAVIEGQVERVMAALPEKTRREASTALCRVFSRQPLRSLAAMPPGAVLRETPLAWRIVADDLELDVHGAADVIWYDGKRWNLVDYKYSRKPADGRGYLLQLKVYAGTILASKKLKRLDAWVVYLKEEGEESASYVRFLPADLDLLRDQLLTLARRLAALDGGPQSEWPLREREYCGQIECAYAGRCHGDAA